AATAHARGRPTSRQAPGTPAVRPQTFGNGASREPGKLTELANPKCFELCGALPLERQQAERQGSEEVPNLLGADDEQLAAARNGGSGEGGEAAAGDADAGVPLRADGPERAAQRGVETPVEPLDPARLEVRGSERGRVDSEACVLERTDDLLPRLLGRSRVGVDEDELRAGRERLAELHLQPHAERLGGRRHRTDERLRAGLRREGRRPQLERWPGPPRGLPVEPGDGEAGDHGNACSTRTHVPLSTW